jgi:hypothetical protein
MRSGFSLDVGACHQSVRRPSTRYQLRPDWNIERDDIWHGAGNSFANRQQRWNIWLTAMNFCRPIKFFVIANFAKFFVGARDPQQVWAITLRNFYQRDTARMMRRPGGVDANDKE